MKKNYGVWLSVGLLLGVGIPAHAVVKKKKAVVHATGTARSGAAHRAAGHVETRSRTKRVRVHAEATDQSRRLSSAFTATTQLRPMAQQLATQRSLPAFNGVLGYAHAHPGEAASAAYLAIGHAYMADHRYADAYNALRLAAKEGNALDDYADYLSAQAAMGAGRGSDAIALLTGFGQKYPESIFKVGAPVLLANAYLQAGNPSMAVQTLNAIAVPTDAKHADSQLTKARALQASGQSAQAIAVYRDLYVRLPLSNEAAQARQQLQSMGASLSAAERKVHADQLFNAKRYGDAGAEYHSINDSSLAAEDRNALEIYEAACDLKQKRLSLRQAQGLPTTSDDSAALKLYILAEISRTEDDTQAHRNYLQQMIERFPHSRWLEEALYSGGNMYLLKHDSTQATWHYQQLYAGFPSSLYAPSSHWRVAWMQYRGRNYADAARLMEEQVTRYPASNEAVAALYWRGRMYEDAEHNAGQAANFYHTLSDTYSNYYYALLARMRLTAIGSAPQVAPSFVLSSVKPTPEVTLIEEMPENDPHLIKARLLANASLNEYIGPEIQESPTSAQWGTLAEAEIYSSFGETWRSLQAMKHSGLSFLSLRLDEVPHAYWELLFPRPYWNDILVNAQKNGEDPYMVAALIRQETEFNPGAVSKANAYGLMQMLIPVGKAEAKRQGLRGFSTQMLLDPQTNIQLGTGVLRETLGRFNNQPEYVFAAYNAGDTPVRNWMALNDYKDLPEFVESIPYTETREYVQALMRNRELYRQIYAGR